MKRETFEEMVREALDSLTAHTANGAVSRRTSRRAGIGGVLYGKAEKAVGQAVTRLAAPGRTSKPISAPTPDLVPPCF